MKNRNKLSGLMLAALIAPCIIVTIAFATGCTPKKSETQSQTQIDYEAYNALITEWKYDSDWNNDGNPNSIIAYALYDIDDNGIKELILHHSYFAGEAHHIFTLKDGKPVNLFDYDENNTPNSAPWSRYGSIEILANGLIDSMNGDYSIYKIAEDGCSVTRIARGEPYDYESEAMRANAQWRYYVMGEVVNKATYDKFLSEQGYKVGESNAVANIDWKIMDTGKIHAAETPRDELSAVTGNGNNPTFPPPINLFQYSVSPSGSMLYGFPGARIWGWSNDGKVAYSIERDIEGRGGQIIDFIIMDTITDDLVFYIKMDSDDHNDAMGEALYNWYEAALSNALKTYNITGLKAEFSRFPARINNTAYNGSIIDIKHKDDEYGIFDTVVTEYTVSVSADNKSKVIGKFTPVNTITGYIYVCGYFLSPFENRVLVVVAEEHRGHEGNELTYRFAGCHLGVGFN